MCERMCDNGYCPILGIPTCASKQDKRRAYLILAWRTHPHLHQQLPADELAEKQERMKSANGCYGFLSNNDNLGGQGAVSTRRLSGSGLETQEEGKYKSPGVYIEEMESIRY